MLTPRTAIVVAALLFLALIVSSVISSLSPPDSGGTKADSFGTGRDGGRGLYDLLTELGIPVERQIAPPSGPPPADAVLVLVAPDPLIVRTEPQPLRRIAQWVQAGGRVVIAPEFASSTQAAQLEKMADELEHFDADLLSALGLDGVRVELLLTSDVPAQHPEDDELVVCRVAESSTGPAADQLDELVTYGPALPEITWDEGIEPVWQTRIFDADNEERVLAAAFARGAGEVVVLADTTLFANVTLNRGQNGVWLLQVLLDGARERVVLDEFYHGLSVRGNAWWLLSQPALAGLAAAGLVLLGLWTWRSGVLLGPPLADRIATRRAIGEYIDAMSRFFLRSREAPTFVLGQLRAGVWRKLSVETGLPTGQDDLDRLVLAISRSDPERGRRVRTAFTQCDQLLKRRAKPQELLSAMRALSELTAAA